GAVKRAETGIWLARYAGSQRQRMGRAYVNFAEPIPLRTRLAELRAEDGTGRHLVERIALDVMHRINRATPAPATAVVCLAMLRAIAELTFLAASERDPRPPTSAPLDAALALRHILKFEFFFPRRREFVEELRTELLMIDPDFTHGPDDVAGDVAAQWLTA